MNESQYRNCSIGYHREHDLHHDFMFSSGGSSQHICTGFQCVGAEEHPRSYPVLLSLPHESGNKTDLKMLILNLFYISFYHNDRNISYISLRNPAVKDLAVLRLRWQSYLSTFKTAICRFGYSLVTKIEKLV